MQSHQIHYFIVLSEERSFTRAARCCGISQPSLTNSIRRLEREIGGQLFSRKPVVELSLLGEIMRPYFERIAHELAEATMAALRHQQPHFPASDVDFETEPPVWPATKGSGRKSPKFSPRKPMHPSAQDDLGDP